MGMGAPGPSPGWAGCCLQHVFDLFLMLSAFRGSTPFLCVALKGMTEL